RGEGSQIANHLLIVSARSFSLIPLEDATASHRALPRSKHAASFRLGKAAGLQPPFLFRDTRRRLRAVKLSLAQRWDLFRHGPAGRRFEFVRRIEEVLRTYAPPEGARYFDVGEFRNWEQ